MSSECERDYWQEYKDGVAQGYINEDGSPREPDESAYLEARAQHEYEEHCDEVHGGKDCDCPCPVWAVGDGPFDDEPPF